MELSCCNKNCLYYLEEQTLTTHLAEQLASSYSLFTYCSIDATKNKLDYYRGKDCMKKFCKDLKEHVTKIINYEKKNDTINN